MMSCCCVLYKPPSELRTSLRVRLVQGCEPVRMATSGRSPVDATRTEERVKEAWAMCYFQTLGSMNSGFIDLKTNTSKCTCMVSTN